MNLLIKDKNAQLQTLEGLSSAVLLLATLFIITQGTTYLTPQTELSLDVQLMQLGNDALIILDTEHAVDGILLKRYVGNWSGAEANISSSAPASIDVNSSQFGTNGQNDLNYSLSTILPENVFYNVDFVYFNGTDQKIMNVIMNGVPMDNSVAVSQLVTLHKNDDDLSNYWNNTISSVYDVQVVEVKLILWYV